MSLILKNCRLTNNNYENDMLYGFIYKKLKIILIDNSLRFFTYRKFVKKNTKFVISK